MHPQLQMELINKKKLFFPRLVVDENQLNDSHHIACVKRDALIVWASSANEIEERI